MGKRVEGHVHPPGRSLTPVGATTFHRWNDPYQAGRSEALADHCARQAPNRGNVTGSLIIVPCLNFPAAQKGKRLSPFDGQNMNRCFPGKEDGTPTERLGPAMI
jgi:hypothetical protein